MTSPGYQFKSPSFQESPVQVVTIGNVDVAHRNASATMLNGGGNVVISLSAFNGPILVWPNPGEQWYVKLLKGQWVLAERNSISAQAYLVNAEPGDQVWDVQGNATISVSGTLNISDENGILATSPIPVWTPVIFENGWSNTGGGFPTVEYIAVGSTVRFRGCLKSGSPITDGTPVFSVPSAFGIPQGQQGWQLASQAGTPGTGSGGLKIVANSGGQFWIYSVGSCTSMFVDSISYFYKY